MNPELLPCPFCGHHAEMEYTGISGVVDQFMAYCAAPDCEPGPYVACVTEQEAVTEWNTRKEPRK